MTSVTRDNAANGSGNSPRNFPPVQIPRFRDLPVDLLRGLAIALMVGANTVPFLLSPPVPYGIRILASLAAPLFIFLSGMMVALTRNKKQYDLRYYLVRGGAVVLIGAALQVLAWGLVPFIDVDVLYLIGISLPLAYLLLGVRPWIRRAIIIAILCAAPVLGFVFGYAPLPAEIPLAQAASGLGSLDLPSLLSYWFIDGWFPVFPWLAIALLGAELGTIRWKGDGITSFVTGKFAAVGLGLVGTGIALWLLFPSPQLIRNGYVEIFYPPVPGFCLAVTGIILLLFILADLVAQNRLPDPLRAMGECSLAIYILHSVIIAWCIAPSGFHVPLPQFLLCCLVFISGMILFAYFLRHVRGSSVPRLFIVKLLIGG
ncbi:MAG: DUF1624 domain-containing protein [Methanoregula sp.]|nr:DUF1624 domain-containing protein [Methanoregula sp.]